MRRVFDHFAEPFALSDEGASMQPEPYFSDLHESVAIEQPMRIVLRELFCYLAYCLRARRWCTDKCFGCFGLSSIGSRAGRDGRGLSISFRVGIQPGFLGLRARYQVSVETRNKYK